MAAMEALAGRCSMNLSVTVLGRCWPRRCRLRSPPMWISSLIQVDEDGRRLVVRNGYHREREVLTAAGAVSVTAPRVNDRRVDADTGVRQQFSSAILPAWARKSPQMAEVLPLLYLRGSPAEISDRLWSSFSVRGPGCRRRRSPD
jgi:hypothetical protein